MRGLIGIFAIGLLGVAAGSARAEFVLVTAEALGDVPANIPGSSTICWPDWNDDGWPDLYIGPGVLFKNNTDGTFTLVDSIGLEPPQSGSLFRTTWADADNDGDLDCAQANFNVSGGSDFSKAYFFMNEGPPDFNFTAVNFYICPTNSRCGQPCFLDADADGTCEIYLGTFGNWDPYGMVPDHFFDDYGEFGIYFDETADWIPQLTTYEYIRHVRGVVACDYDNDFDTDIFVPVYGVSWSDPSWENYLWQNDGSGHFTDVAEEAGVAVEPHGRYGVGLASGASWGDYDNDGLFDLIVANIHGWAALYHNEGDGTFSNVTLEAGLDTSATYGVNEKQWHNTLWVDMDNDGDLDLFLSQWYTSQGYTSYVYENRGPDSLGYFEEVTNQIGFNNSLDFMTDQGFAAADYDRDGDMDIFMHGTAPGYAGKYLYRNDLNAAAAENHWLVIKLVGDGVSCGLSALNARIRLHYADETWSGSKQVEATSADQVMNMQPVHFGLGEHDYVEAVVVYWPCGTAESFSWEDIGGSVDRWITLVEGTSSGVAVDIDAALGGREREVMLLPCYPNPCNPHGIIRFTLPAAADVSLRAYDVTGDLVKNIFRGKLGAGRHELTFEGEGLSSGVYFIKLQSGVTLKFQKILLLR